MGTWCTPLGVSANCRVHVQLRVRNAPFRALQLIFNCLTSFQEISDAPLLMIRMEPRIICTKPVTIPIDLKLGADCRRPLLIQNLGVECYIDSTTACMEQREFFIRND
jgi:hypothetical protein